MPTAQEAAAANAAYRNAQATQTPLPVGGSGSGTHVINITIGPGGVVQEDYTQEFNGVTTSHKATTFTDTQLIQQQEQARTLDYGMDRAGYSKTLGDSQTQVIVNSLMAQNPMMSLTQAQGIALEQQRQSPRSTPSLTDDRFFANELQKWVQNKIELSSEYHFEGMEAGIPIPANPFENQSDISLALLKGGNPKDFTQESFGFNPNVGTELNFLPDGKGLQEYAWNVAVAFDRGQPAPGPVDFLPGINFLNSQEGRQGVYGNLWGGIPDISQKPVQDSIAGLPAPFLSVAGPLPSRKYTPNPIFFGLGAINTPVAKAMQWFTSPGDIAETTVGQPYVKGDSIIFPTMTTTVPVPSEYQKTETGASKFIQGFLPEGALQTLKLNEMIQGEIAGSTPNLPNLYASMGTSEMRDLVENPIRAGTSYAIGFGTGVVFRGSAAVFPNAAKQFPRITKNAPRLLAGFYGVDVAYRSTEGLTDFRPVHVAQKGVPTLMNEGLPMAGGFSGGYNFADSVRTVIANPPSLRGVRGRMSDTIFRYQQGRAGITRLPTRGGMGATGSDIMGTEVPVPVRQAMLDDMIVTRAAHSGEAWQPPSGKSMSVGDRLYMDAIRNDIFVTRATKAYRQPFTPSSKSQMNPEDRIIRDAIRNDLYVTRVTSTFRSKTPLYDMFGPRTAQEPAPPAHPFTQMEREIPLPKRSVQFRPADEFSSARKLVNEASFREQNMPEVFRKNMPESNMRGRMDLETAMGGRNLPAKTPLPSRSAMGVLPYWATPSQLEEAAMAERSFARQLEVSRNRWPGPAPSGETRPFGENKRNPSPITVPMPGEVPTRRPNPDTFIVPMGEIFPKPKITPVTTPMPQPHPEIKPVPTEQPKPPRAPPVVIVPGLPILPGGGGGSTYGRRGTRSWKYKNPTITDIMTEGKKMRILKPFKGLKSL